ncbi:hypothetical protein KVR01_013469 [Diaporthe batatas]|uniref:uncharacterized protein n=1 Tax=Diaporthe batatas TaxID=748121 RepID=UPI001D05A868|nr:uncharacterized protein KVR01_013469 [Diaporthe batatas]KAG8156678.1 hypothetical protein KVR01_013469 [Diaporthe batatas]
MSSSSSASALNRSRSLRQPTAGLSRGLKKDEASVQASNNVNTAAAAAAANVAAATTNKGVPAAGRTSPSRLPKPPGGTSIATRTRAATAGKASGIPSAAASGTRSRPTSGIFGRSDSLAEPSKSARPARPAPISTTRLIRPSSRPAPTSSEPSPTTPSRSSPSRVTPPKPTATATATASPSPVRTASQRTNTHIRAKSSATALNSATVLRPPRPPSAAASVASTSTSTSTTNTTATAAPKKPIGRANIIAATRAGHLRQESAPTHNTRPTTTTTAPAADAPRLKPAFNTLQQHYSPARNLAPKPLTSSYLAPPSPSKLPANVAISSETARLQTELLQLHLLHRDADAVAASWHASARQRLGSRFAELARAGEDVRKEEAVVEEARNLAALVAWGGGGGGGGRELDGKIQVLDAVLSGVWSLGEPNGRYTRAVRKFEKWVDQTRRAVEARRVAGGLGALMDDGEVGFISELDPAWRDEVSSMARKLDSWRRQLGQLESGVFDGDRGEDFKSCSLTRILSGCRSQVHGMLAELDLMEQIERDALAQETAWIRNMNRGDDESDTPRAGAIWRAF